jgi:hypothetical protein
MALVVISVDRSKLPEHTDQQFDDWVKYCVGELGGISMDNPLHECDLEATVRECG